MAGMCVKIWLVFLRECALLNVVRLFLNNFATLEINCIKVKYIVLSNAVN